MNRRSWPLLMAAIHFVIAGVFAHADEAPTINSQESIKLHRPLSSTVSTPLTILQPVSASVEVWPGPINDLPRMGVAFGVPLTLEAVGYRELVAAWVGRNAKGPNDTDRVLSVDEIASGSPLTDLHWRGRIHRLGAPVVISRFHTPGDIP